MSMARKDGTETTSVDVVIVGSGFAGLTAAEHLVSKGLTVRVLEGRDRVGGRSFSGEIAGVEVDLGATWVSPRHTAIRELAQRMGCTTTPQFAKGSNVLWMAGRRHKYQGTIPPVSPIVMVDMARMQLALDKLLQTVNVDAAWESPDATELDSLSFGEWLDRKQALPKTRAMMAIISKVQWGCSPADVSLLHVLRYIRAAGGLNHMLDVENGANQDRIAETTQEIAKRLAERLGDRIVVNAPVRRIDQNDNGVSIQTDATTIKAQYAIVTVAPPHRGDIGFQPPLPEKGAGLARTWPMGALSKAFVAYDRPFWRAEGLSGEALTDTGTAFITFDVSPDPTGPGILMVFCSPRVFDGFSPELRRSRVVRQLVDLYGPKAQTPIDYIDHCWGADSFAPGGPHPAAPPYASVSYGSALTDPHGRIHWAGTETAGEWAGTMNGAVITGQRVADRIAGLVKVKEAA
ncbi:MAG: flavin monoamine oxidase family protein [Arthrobacter sp.]|nr:flavin monoamine oxidase family protein [Arthrobacter sp.]